MLKLGYFSHVRLFCKHMNWSLPGSSLHGIEEARILEWVAFPTPGIFLTQGLNLSLLSLLHWQMGSLPLVLHSRGSLNVCGKKKGGKKEGMKEEKEAGRKEQKQEERKEGGKERRKGERRAMCHCWHLPPPSWLRTVRASVSTWIPCVRGWSQLPTTEAVSH